ncbi:MAG TPA: ABC transporter ATP-binding protein [Chloroflexota bacterium]|nr:ABC transporter ATP-binding protein [Chloroflexota bacterium]
MAVERKPLLEVKNLKTWFYTPDGIVKAVNGVSFTLNEGEALGLVGESGCGKSVSAMSLMRLIPTPPGRIVEGEVIFDGRDLIKLNDEGIRRIRGNDIAMIFQDPMTSLNPVLTIGRQIGEALELHKGMNGDQARKRTIELLELVGIPSAKSRHDDYPHQFSGGMRQRVMIAMALALDPDVLIADEPTTALDVTVQAQIMKLLSDLQAERNMGLILITHDMGVVADVADRISIMYAGRIIEEAPVHDIYATPAHPYTKALLESIPRLDQKGQDLNVIRGLPPNLANIPKGCAFNPRCRYVKDECRVDPPPPVYDVSANRTSACHFWQEVVGRG